MSDLSYLDEHRAYIGSSGSGKSTTARVDVEKLLADKRHVCITDHTGVWYGLRSDRAGTGPGFDIPIFGGRRGDVPFSAGDGDAIGRLVGEQGISAIVDLSGLRTGFEQRTFMAAFVAALRRKPAGHFQLVCDEADEDVPEKTRDDVAFALQEDMIWIAKRGRSDGFVLSLITQRPASVAKEALSQMQTIFAHQLTLPLDTKAFGAFVREHGTREEFREIMGRLPALQVGERYLYRPRQHQLELGTTPLPVTFDSSRTPGPGEQKREPKMLAQLDVSAIAAALQKPREEAAIAAYSAGREVGELLVEKNARIRTLEDRVAELQADLAVAQEVENAFEFTLRAVRRALDNAPKRPGASQAGRAQGEAPPPPAPAPVGAEEAGAPGKRRERAPSASHDGAHPLAVALSEKMAAVAPARLTWRQLASLCGYKPDGGYFRGGKRDALNRGLLIEEGGYVRSSVEAKSSLDRASAYKLWSDVLPEPAPRLMEALAGQRGERATKGDLAAELGYSADGGYFRKGLSLLRQNGIIVEHGDVVGLANLLPGQVA